MAPPYLPSGSSQLNKPFAVSPPLVSEILSAPPSFLIQKINCLCLCLYVCVVAVDLKAAKRTQNFTGKRLRDNSFIVGSYPQPGIPDGMKFALSQRPLKHGLHWMHYLSD